jgi:hypothetical protein
MDLAPSRMTSHERVKRLALAMAVTIACPLALSGCDSGGRSRGVNTANGTAAPTTSAGTGTGNGTAPGTSGTAPGTTAPGVAQGVFTPSADMINARGQHSATLLSNGRVLVVGGADGTGTLSESEVFDPLTANWQRTRDLSANPDDGLMLDPTGQFPTARQLHTATVLGDGRVLVGGGIGIERMNAQGQPVFEILSTAYLFDAGTNTFTAAPNLPTAAAWQLSSQGPNGEGILAGGMDANMTSTLNVSVFDPTTDLWSTQTMGSAHTWGTMVSITGQSLVIGGGDVQQGANGNLGVAAPATLRVESFGIAGATSPATANTADLIFPASTPLATGGVLVSGGQALNGQQFQVSGACEVFDGQSTWSAGPTLTTPRYQHQAVRVGAQGEILIVAGVDAAGQPLAQCELYNADSNQILGTVDLATPRVDHQVVRLPSGQVVVIGGFDGQQAPVAQTEIYTR